MSVLISIELLADIVGGGIAPNVRGTTPLFLPLLNDQFSRGKNNGATTIVIYQQRERRSALCYAFVGLRLTAFGEVCVLIKRR
jgi:hypothetical protein